MASPLSNAGNETLHSGLMRACTPAKALVRLRHWYPLPPSWEGDCELSARAVVLAGLAGMAGSRSRGEFHRRLLIGDNPATCGRARRPAWGTVITAER